MQKYRKLELIDGLRGLAILGVLHHHLFWDFTRPGFVSIELAGFSLPLLPFFSNGFLGVNLFFFLSGFVLYLPYCTGKRGLETREQIWQFYKRRFFRLMPLYYFVLLVSVTFFHFPRGLTLTFWRDLALMLTASFVFYPKQFFPDFNFLLWSLGVEIWFSLLFPFLVLAIRRLGLLRVGLVVCLFSLGVRFYDAIYQPFQVGGFYLSFLRDNIFGRLDGFYCGMLGCFVYVNFESLRPGTRHVLFWGSLGLMLGGMWIWDLMYLKQLSFAFAPLTNNCMDLGFLGLSLSLFFTPKSLLKDLICAKPLRLLGIMCYSIYLWHGIVLQKLQQPEFYSFQGLTAYFLLTLSLSAMSYRYVEFRKVEDWRGLFLWPWFKAKETTE